MLLSKSKPELGILVLLMSFLVATSCVETNYTLGYDLVPNTNNLFVETATMDLKVGMKSTDNIQSSSYYYAVGDIVSEEFGLTSVSLAATLTPSDTGIKFGKDPRLIDAYLEMNLDNISTFTDGQENITQNFYVFPMAHAMDSTMVTSNSIGENDYIHTPIGHTILTSQDTVYISLDRQWAQKLLDATRAELDTMELFMKNHFGLYFRTDLPMEGMIGGRINNFLTMNVKLDISSINSQDLRRDTTITFNVGNIYNGVSTQVFRHSSSSLEIGSENDAQVLYYEGLGGVKPFIDAKVLKRTLDNWAEESNIDISKILVTRATFELPYEFPGDYRLVDYNYPQGLYPAVYSLDSLTNIRRYNLLGSIYDESYNKGEINRSLYCYRPDVTYYIQALINRNNINEDDDLWLIAPFEYTETTSTANSSYYNPYMYYDPYSYGYGGYGYGGYGYGSYYNSMYYSSLYNAASTSSTTYYYVDYINYAIGRINGNGAARHPKLHITYVRMED